ncbi:LOW QUALITY PROTEIN: bromodomain adjacent to zinc finger domain protein 1A [Anopheles bellator]|uniref:LOW QUALITY PROTEIN: bromodomain adjacent to zinc finger domain protein 1A n=1 Tax=Anopheles bellator TaxID=139047 RepID=UPI002647FA78|nr:LOW QUALITY PROTEIN: bromodomain adjacent to zinc finger domain protein 1A [Anopheles bellator]
MPLLRKEVPEKVPETERLRDNDKVFFCEATGEIFSNFEDYFHRVMLISSVVWICELTGRSNLTYAEALESENAARKLLETFPASVKGPFLLVASHTKRTSIIEMHDDVYSFIKDHIFKGEVVDVLDPTGRGFRRAKVTKVVLHSKQHSSPGGSIQSKLMYHVTADDKLQPRTWVSEGAKLKRDRRSLTRDKCKLFLKQHVEAGPGGLLLIKEASLKKFVYDEGWTDQQVFFDHMPDFEPSKRLKMREERSKAIASGTKGTSKRRRGKIPVPLRTRHVHHRRHRRVPPPQGQKKRSKSTKDTGGGAVPKGPKDGNHQEAVKSVTQKQSNNTKLKTGEEAKKITKELELQKAVEDVLIAKKRLEEEKAMLVQHATFAIKKFNTVLDDQQLTDHRVLPPARPVCTLIGPDHFSNFVFIMEFMHSFSDLLAIRNKFPNGLTMELLERALLQREVNGPLSDILQVLLSTIFAQQLDEENEVDVRYDRPENIAQKRLTVPDQARASDCVTWIEKHYSMSLNELPIDSTTISELLRLHFLSSGALVEERAAKHRYCNRGGYSSADDPGLRLVQDFPHIFRALKAYPVYQLPIGDIIQLLCCLIHQLLTYSGVREMVEERLEKARSARIKFQGTRVAQRRLMLKTGSLKTTARDEFKKELNAFQGTDQEKESFREKLQDKLEEQLTRIDATAQRELRPLQQESDRLKEDFFDYQIYIGTDRSFRNYWLFESLAGLFVEHDRTFVGPCLTRPTTNIPGLANCASEQRKKFITKSVMQYGQGLDAQYLTANEWQEEVYEKLLLQSSADLYTMTPTNEELLMCTADWRSCPVHGQADDGRSVRWSFYASADELDSLIKGLNVRGVREKQLRETLECERDLILTHIEKCPLEKLYVADCDRAARLADIITRNQKKYDAPNFDHAPGTEPNEILEAVFRENLLELESKITIGYLGVMKVHDRYAWRAAIKSQRYDPQTDEPLVWGPRRLLNVGVGTNGKQGVAGDEQLKDTITNGGAVAGKNEEHQQARDAAGGGGSDGEGDIDLDRLLSNAHDPGYNLPDTGAASAKSCPLDETFTFPLHDSETLQQCVHSLALALLQIEQCIEHKFLRHPFGPKKDYKDRSVMLHKQQQGQKNLAIWEVSLMRATSFSQLFLHYNVLYDAIYWSRSAERISCMICRRKVDPYLTLLCDECNRACHMYCLKPKLKEVPAGDWFCIKCRPENFQVKRAPPAKKKKIFQWEDRSDEEKEDESSEGEADEEESFEADTTNDSDENYEKVKTVADSKVTIRGGNTGSGSGSRGAGAADAVVKPVVTKRRNSRSAAVAAAEAIEASKRQDEDDGYGNDSEDHDDDEDDQDEEGDDGDDHQKPMWNVVRSKSMDVSRNGSKRRNTQRKVQQQRVDQQGAGVNSSKPKRPLRSIMKRSPASAIKISPKHVKASSGSGSGKRQREDDDLVDSDSEPLARISTRSNARGGTRSSTRSSVKRHRLSLANGSLETTLANGDGGDQEISGGGASGTGNRRSRRFAEDLPLNSVALYALINEILKHPDSWPFNRRVSAKEVPDYYAVIKTPMDFARIKSKLNMGDYKTNEEMLSDVQLVFSNCDLYNTDEDDVYRIGKSLEGYVVQRCMELALPFQPSDMQKRVKQNLTSTTKVNGTVPPPRRNTVAPSSTGRNRFSTRLRKKSCAY